MNDAVATALIHAAQRVEERLEEVLAGVGLSCAKFGALGVLVGQDQPISLSELAEKLTCVRSNVTQLVDRLEADGLAKRIDHPADRRAVRAEVTALGRERHATGATVVNAVLQDVAKELSAIDPQELKRALDVLVNNAAVYKLGPIEAMTEEEFHREFNTNVLGPLLMIREAVKYFGQRGGIIINIGSMASQVTPPNLSIYTATKGALDAITRALAKELGPRQIRVNSINPGATATEGALAAGVIGVGSDSEKQMIAMTPLGRIGQPSDIAPTAVFLASDESGWLTGEVICASGGWR